MPVHLSRTEISRWFTVQRHTCTNQAKPPDTKSSRTPTKSIRFREVCFPNTHQPTFNGLIPPHLPNPNEKGNVSNQPRPSTESRAELTKKHTHYRAAPSSRVCTRLSYDKNQVKTERLPREATVEVPKQRRVEPRDSADLVPRTGTIRSSMTPHQNASVTRVPAGQPAVFTFHIQGLLRNGIAKA